MQNNNDKKIINSWKTNAAPWISAIRKNEIKSRLLVTNNAIVEAVINSQAKTALDVGCGEGWLTRELQNLNISTLGVDAIPELINSALEQNNGRFKVMTYENISHTTLNEKFDAVVCNFSLLGDESVSGLFEQIPLLLSEGGSFIIQTIHPILGCGDGEYIDGWREGSWRGFNNDFSDPAPWYFRTLDTWKVLFHENGFVLDELIAPVNEKTGVVASVIFVGRVRA
ncbi:hypothetical protein MNBD_GAMMA07-1107 [hydrothermal vent metagenome]|uniref:Uncharacterized protein n=1 Tax=hydrothermal vent metagenome TaxID=652676 RepID=A0A3B0WUA8_9ZZZZ